MENTDNLIYLLNKLSYQIVNQELDRDKDLHSRRRNEKFFKKCAAKLRQKGCDVLLNKTGDPPPEDPCLTDYGGNWSPMTFIMEYGRELKGHGAAKCNEILMNSTQVLEEKEYDHLKEILKVLLILKKPFVESSKLVQNEISFSNSGFLSNSIESFSLLSGDMSRSSFKKAIQYEESWTKTFDSKFEVLGEYSKKNLLTPDKVSLDSLFTARSLNKNQSQSNSFVFTDFFTEKTYKSEKDLFHCNNTYLNETPLLDSFVDNPITHKLPSLTFSQRCSSRNEFLERLSEHAKEKLDLLSEEDFVGAAQRRNLCSDGVINLKQPLNNSSTIELKRNSNCSHSFSVMYEKSQFSKSQGSSLESNESLLCIKNWKKSGKCANNWSHSKEIVLALWEEEQKLIREFKPDLANCFPALRMISLADFVEDVKYLMTGINSGTFEYDLYVRKFSMQYGTCLEDVTPESLYHFSEEFLNIGNCYVWLNSFATEIGRSNLDACTTISQAFWKSVFDFLELHYSVILEIPRTTNLMALKACTKELHEVITALGEICKVSQLSGSLPQGGQLLTYLLQVAERVSTPSIINIIFGILQNCSNVYFMCILQTWMFKGQLERQNSEFFIDYRRQKVKTKSRAYYNSFYIDEEKVPSFLRGCEESIYNCGKSIHFLKLFNPEDKFCQFLEKVEYPHMRLCLSDVELEKLQREFKEYRNKVIESCGKSISIKDLREEEKENERYFQEHIKECKKMLERARELKQMREFEELKARKDLQNKLLNEQMIAIEAEKARKKEKEKEEELRIEQLMKKSKSNREQLLKSERELIKDHYDKLLKTLEDRLNLAEARKQSLKQMLSNQLEKTELLDLINQNAPNGEAETNDNKAQAKETTNDNATDAEGNFKDMLDVNSNSSLLENVVRVIEASEPFSPDAEKAAESSSPQEGVLFDENDNPSNRNLPTGKLTGKSISHRTLAATEAEKNKLKILRSEFGLAVRKGTPPKETAEPKEEKPMSDLERNRRRVLESEYDILKRASGCVSLKCVPSNVQMVKENELATDSKLGLESDCSSQDVTLQKVDLQRKKKCTDLESPVRTTGTVSAEPSVSLVTPSVEIFSEESSSVIGEMNQSAISVESSCKVLNENYQSALIRDLEMFHHRITLKNVFSDSKELEFDTPLCTDFMKFQRYLRKSVMIPLKTQEKLANDALLTHLLKGENLLSHLQSLRGYFFLNDGEFGRSFTHNTFRSLAKCTEPQQFFERSNLSNIVNEALNYTIHTGEPNSQNLSFQIVQMPPFLNHSSHDVLSPFELSYRVDWPLNIILTEKALSKYKTVFRFLLKLKRINWTLHENFLYLNSHFKGNKRKTLVSSWHYHKIQIYRHAMTQVMITLDDYIFSDGVQFPWLFFLKDLETAENIDHLYQKHVRYIKDVLTRCFLSKNSEDLLDCIHSLIELALKFHYTTKSAAMEVIDGKYVHPKFHVLKTTFSEFCLVVKTFLKTLKEKISSNQILKSHYVLIEKFDLKLT